MKIRVQKSATGGNPVKFIRRCGYGEYFDRRMNKVSYMKRAHISMMFPRFHVYIKEEGDSVVFDLHLDQKRQSYEGTAMHSGEYEGTAVEREAARIRAFVAKNT